MDYTQMTLGVLLSAKDETIRRNAQSILKQLQRNAAAEECYWECGRKAQYHKVRDDIPSNDGLGAHNTEECSVCVRKTTQTLIREAKERGDKRFSTL